MLGGMGGQRFTNRRNNWDFDASHGTMHDCTSPKVTHTQKHNTYSEEMSYKGSGEPECNGTLPSRMDSKIPNIFDTNQQQHQHTTTPALKKELRRKTTLLYGSTQRTGLVLVSGLSSQSLFLRACPKLNWGSKKAVSYPCESHGHPHREKTD